MTRSNSNINNNDNNNNSNHNNDKNKSNDCNINSINFTKIVHHLVLHSKSAPAQVDIATIIYGYSHSLISTIPKTLRRQAKAIFFDILKKGQILQSYIMKTVP